MNAKHVGLLLCLFAPPAQGASSATAIDPTFQPVTLAPGLYGANSIVTMALQSDGKILIAGWFNAVNGQPRNNVARLNVDGSLDASFLPALATNQVVTSMVLHDGKIVVNTTAGGGAVTRLNTDGSIDASFNMPPETSNWILSPDVYLSPLGEIFLGGQQVRSEDGGYPNLFVARVSESGALTFDIGTHWVPHVMMAENGTVVLAFQSDSKLIVAGYFSTDSGRQSFARFNRDGTEDLTFDAPAFVRGWYPLSLTVQPDDKIIYAFRSSRAELVRLNANGTFDKSFPLPAKSEFVLSVALQRDGKVLANVGGDYGRYVELLRFNADATIDTSFESTIVGKPLVQPDGKIVLAGSFTNAGPNGPISTRLVRLRGDPVVLTGNAINQTGVQLRWTILDSAISYKLEASDDLKIWTTAQTIASGATAINYNESLREKRFFRVAHQ